MAKRIKGVRYDSEDLQVTLSSGEEIQIVTWDAPGVKPGGMDFVIHHVSATGKTTHFESPTDGPPSGPLSHADLEEAHRRIKHSLKGVETTTEQLRLTIEERAEHMKTVAALGQEKIALMVQVEMFKDQHEKLVNSLQNEERLRSSLEHLLCREQHLKAAIRLALLGQTPSRCCMDCDRCNGNPLY